MLKRILWLVLAVACGGDDQEIRVSDRGTALEIVRDERGRAIEAKVIGADKRPDSEADLGVLEVPYTSKFSPGRQIGTSQTHRQCDRSNPGQKCSIITGVGNNPHVVTYYIDPDSFNASYRAEIRQIVEEMDSQLTTWVFNEVFTEDPWPLLYFNDLPCPGTSNDITINPSFVCVNLTQTWDTLTTYSHVGQYTTHEGAIVHLDMAKIKARADTTIRRLRLVRHAAGNGSGTTLGLGSRADQAASLFNSWLYVDVDWVGFPLSSGEVCRLESYVATDNGFLFPTGPVCSSN